MDKIVMITHVSTGKQFENRLQAKLYYGHSNYNRMCRNHEFRFTSNNKGEGKSLCEKMNRK